MFLKYEIIQSMKIMLKANFKVIISSINVTFNQLPKLCMAILQDAVV